MAEPSANGRPKLCFGMRCALAGAFCLVLLLAGGIQATHAAEGYTVSHGVEVAGADGACDGCSSANPHDIGSDCSLVPGCAMSAALVGTADLPTPSAASVGPGDDQLRRGTAPLPHRRPPKLSIAA